MSEEIKERLEKLRREYRPSMAGDVCLSWAADVAPALSEALALITSLTAELTAARAEVERLRGGTGMSESEAWSEADCLAYDPFAGDDYGNDFVDFGAKIVNGRKVYQCHICQGPIAKGERHRVDSCILDGERLHARFCGICCAAMAISSEDGGEAITAREPEFQPPLLDDPLMTTPDLEGLAREPIKTLADVLCWIDNMAHATAYYEGKANDDAIEAGDVLRALIRSAPAPGREEIARIIDPSIWKTLDMYFAEAVQRGGKPDRARYKDGQSLTKADAILALFHAPAEAGGGEAEKKLCPECQGTGLQRIEGLYDDCPKCDGDGLVSPSPTPPAGDGWRLIDEQTPIRDEILVGNKWGVWLAWRGPFGEDGSGGEFYDGDGEVMSNTSSLTHWRPLPPPPVSKGEKL